ncbi:hypothetical protein cyc_05156 [Cyclospora cayetanensis]|uniref:Uncharacterized protein n=1 Tax=Cyclospora cayetanensis TaxID=88456 RepID=A0A1D3D2B0_9EIME|nr:hypothetical protein cyc_05156 [Cyclospora cayetanensis]
MLESDVFLERPSMECWISPVQPRFSTFGGKGSLPSRCPISTFQRQQQLLLPVVGLCCVWGSDVYGRTLVEADTKSGVEFSFCGGGTLDSPGPGGFVPRPAGSSPILNPRKGPPPDSEVHAGASSGGVRKLPFMALSDIIRQQHRKEKSILLVHILLGCFSPAAFSVVSAAFPGLAAVCAAQVADGAAAAVITGMCDAQRLVGCCICSLRVLLGGGGWGPWAQCVSYRGAPVCKRVWPQLLQPQDSSSSPTRQHQQQNQNQTQQGLARNALFGSERAPLRVIPSGAPAGEHRRVREVSGGPQDAREGGVQRVSRVSPESRQYPVHVSRTPHLRERPSRSPGAPRGPSHEHASEGGPRHHSRGPDGYVATSRGSAHRYGPEELRERSSPHRSSYVEWRDGDRGAPPPPGPRYSSPAEQGDWGPEGPSRWEKSAGRRRGLSPDQRVLRTPPEHRQRHYEELQAPCRGTRPSEDIPSGVASRDRCVTQEEGSPRHYGGPHDRRSRRRRIDSRDSFGEGGPSRRRDSFPEPCSPPRHQRGDWGGPHAEGTHRAPPRYRSPSPRSPSPFYREPRRVHHGPSREAPGGPSGPPWGPRDSSSPRERWGRHRDAHSSSRRLSRSSSKVYSRRRRHSSSGSSRRSSSQWKEEGPLRHTSRGREGGRRSRSNHSRRSSSRGCRERRSSSLREELQRRLRGATNGSAPAPAAATAERAPATAGGVGSASTAAQGPTLRGKRRGCDQEGPPAGTYALQGAHPFPPQGCLLRGEAQLEAVPRGLPRDPLEAALLHERAKSSFWEAVAPEAPHARICTFHPRRAPPLPHPLGAPNPHQPFGGPTFRGPHCASGPPMGPPYASPPLGGGPDMQAYPQVYGSPPGGPRSHPFGVLEGGYGPPGGPRGRRPGGPGGPHPEGPPPFILRTPRPMQGPPLQGPSGDVPKPPPPEPPRGICAPWYPGGPPPPPFRHPAMGLPGVPGALMLGAVPPKKRKSSASPSKEASAGAAGGAGPPQQHQHQAPEEVDAEQQHQEGDEDEGAAGGGWERTTEQETVLMEYFNSKAPEFLASDAYLEGWSKRDLIEYFYDQYLQQDMTAAEALASATLATHTFASTSAARAEAMASAASGGF